MFLRFLFIVFEQQRRRTFFCMSFCNAYLLCHPFSRFIKETCSEAKGVEYKYVKWHDSETVWEDGPGSQIVNLQNLIPLPTHFYVLITHLLGTTHDCCVWDLWRSVATALRSSRWRLWVRWEPLLLGERRRWCAHAPGSNRRAGNWVVLLTRCEVASPVFAHTLSINVHKCLH